MDVWRPTAAERAVSMPWCEPHGTPPEDEMAGGASAGGGRTSDDAPLPSTSCISRSVSFRPVRRTSVWLMAAMPCLSMTKSSLTNAPLAESVKEGACPNEPDDASRSIWTGLPEASPASLSTERLGGPLIAGTLPLALGAGQARAVRSALNSQQQRGGYYYATTLAGREIT